jgi:hypothetical protein
MVGVDPENDPLPAIPERVVVEEAYARLKAT